MESTDQNNSTSTSTSTPATTKRKHDSNDTAVVSPDSNDCNDEENDNRKRMRPNALLLSESEVTMPSSSNKDKDENIGSLTLNDERLSSQSTQEEILPPSKSPKNTFVSSEPFSVAAPLENSNEERCDTMAPAERLERASSQDNLSKQHQTSSFSPQADVVYLEQLLLGSNKVLAQHKEQSQRVLDLKEENQSLKKSLTTAKSESTGNKHQMQLCEAKLKVSEDRLRKLQVTLKDAEGSRQELVEELENQRQLAESRLAEATKYQNQMHLSGKIVQETKRELKKVQDQLQDTQANLELAEELVNQRQLAESRSTEATESLRQMNLHGEIIEETKQELKNLQGQLKSTQATKKQLTEVLESQIVLAAKRSEETGGLREALSAAKTDAAGFHRQVQLREREMAELQVALKDTLDTKKKLNQELEYQRQLAERRLEYGRKLNEELFAAKTDAMDYRRQVGLQAQHCETKFKEAQHKLQLHLKKVQVELKDAQGTKNQRLTQELENERLLDESRLEDGRQLEKALSAARNDAKQCRQRIQFREKEMAGLQSYLKETKANLKDARSSKRQLMEDLEFERVLAEGRIEENRALNKALSAAKTDATACQQKLQLYEKEMVELQHQLEKVQVELKCHKHSNKNQRVEENQSENQRNLVAERLEEERNKHQLKEQAHLRARGALQKELHLSAQSMQEKEQTVSILRQKLQLAEERLEQLLDCWV